MRPIQSLRAPLSRTVGLHGHSGIEAAETEESIALGRMREASKDGTAGETGTSEFEKTRRHYAPNFPEVQETPFYIGLP